MLPLILIGTGVAGLTYILWPKKHSGEIPKANLATDHLAAGVPSGPKIVPLLDALRAEGMVIPKFEGLTGNPTLAQAIAQKGMAVAPAKALYASLKQSGLSKTPAALILTFQNATGSDATAKILTGPVPATGIFDLPTSAALTVYTGDPIPPDPGAPPLTTATAVPGVSPDMSVPGGAAMAGNNLYTYLKASGTKDTPTKRALVFAFQHQVNVDPKFPGPASVAPLIKIVKVPLKEDGLTSASGYGQKTADALAIGTGDRIAP